jgi:signal transduction histidine kinase
MGAGHAKLFGRKRDGSEFPAEISLSPLESDDGLLSIAAIRDATERIRAEEQRARLAQAQEMIRMRDDFLSIASHELKTPLTTLQLQIDSILRASHRKGAPIAAAVLMERAEFIDSALRRLAKLIDQLLDITRITSGRLALDLTEADLNTLVRNMVEQHRDQAAHARCKLELHPTPERLKGFWDPLRIEEVITNLLSNAVKYGAGGRVDITTAAGSDGAAILTVADQGIGIAPENHQRIFERFQRVASHPDRRGFGLGLWISRQIVEAHGGIIRVSSRLGEGAAFIVELPRATPRR